MTSTCAIEGCSNVPSRRSLCEAHRLRRRRGVADCAVPMCMSTSRRDGYCVSHAPCPVRYRTCRCGAVSLTRQRRHCAPAIVARVERPCDHCGAPFEATPSRRFCSTECRRRSYLKPPRPLFDHRCGVCDEAFTSVAENARYCSNRCRRRAGKKSVSETRRRRSYDRVRALRPAVIAAYGYRCHLCGEGIPLVAPANDPEALTLDHVIPASRGGEDTMDNLRPAHRRCNYRRADRLIEVAA